MSNENFVSSSLSRKQFQEILDLFHDSKEQLGEDRNKIKRVSYKGQSLVVKSFKIPNAVNRIAYRFLRKSKAQRSYENATYLLQHQIGTPAPIAYLEQTTGLCFNGSYYVSVYEPHDFTFRELINDDTLEDKEQILIEFTRFIYQMHEAQIYFLDNSPGNTLIRKTENGYAFFLVDLNRMKFYDIPVSDRLKNFERLSPQRWMYEIMGTEYARLIKMDTAQTINTMWDHVQQFQRKFHKKKEIKQRLKALIGKY